MEYKIAEESTDKSTDKKKVEFIDEIKDVKQEKKEEPMNPIVAMAEYIWISDYEQGTICSKTKTVVFTTNEISTKYLRQKIYNGTLTGEVDDDKSSDIILQPIYICNDPIRGNPNILVLCETFYLDGQPTINNKRNELFKAIETKEMIEKYETLFSFKQEITIYEDKQENKTDENKSYCKVGKMYGKYRSLMNQFYIWCLKAGINMTGFNSGSTLNKWEFNIGPGFGIRTSDDLILARYLLMRITEMTDINVDFVNDISGNNMTLKMYYSIKDMRNENGDEVVETSIEKLKRKHKDFIKLFGTKQDSKFTHGVGTNNTSIKYPIIAKMDKRNKYLVDNRVTSNADPYIISKNIFDTICN